MFFHHTKRSGSGSVCVERRIKVMAMAGELKLKDVKLEVFCPNCHGYEEYKDGKCAWCGFNHIRKLSVKEREPGLFAYGICSFVRAERAMKSLTDSQHFLF